MNTQDMDSLFAGHKLVLLEFQADWCEPCKWAEPVVNDVMNHFGDSMHLHKLDIDAHPSISRDFNILSVPTFVLMKEGKEVWRLRGYDISPVMIRSLEPFVA